MHSDGLSSVLGRHITDDVRSQGTLGTLSSVCSAVNLCFHVHIDPWRNRNREVGLHSVFLIALIYSMLLAFKVLSAWDCILWTRSSHGSLSNTTRGSLQNNTYFCYETFDVSEIKLIVYFFSNFLSGNVITKHINYRCTFKISVGELSRKFFSEWLLLSWLNFSLLQLLL